MPKASDRLGLKPGFSLSEGEGSRAGIFAQNGEMWILGLDGPRFALKDIKGLRYIQRLLQHPGQEFHVLDILAEPGHADGLGETDKAGLLANASVRVAGLGDAGEMLDARAKDEYRRRLRELTEELEECRSHGKPDRAEEIETEIDFIIREISRAVGLGGRDRRAGSAAERARLNVTRAIKTALQKITDHDRMLAESIDRGLRTGIFCRYVLDPATPVVWQFSVDERHATSSAAKPDLAYVYLAGADLLGRLNERTALVGRDKERAALLSIFDQSRGGSGRVVMIAGAPGVGKTRIAAEFAHEAAEKGALAFVGACYDREDAVPFIPFVEIFENALAQSRDPRDFRDVIGDEAPEIARLMPKLRRVFPDIPAPMELPPEQTRRILLGAIVQVLSRAAATRPILLLLDDLHWADEGTLSLLNHLARSATKIPLMIIGTYRDNELDLGGPVAKLLDEFTRAYILTRINLDGLSENSVGAMIRALSGRAAPPELTNYVFSSTRGNPFFIEELIRHLMEREKLFEANGEFRRDFSASDIDVPQSVRLVVGRRLARLSAPAQEMLKAAAVVGPSFAFELLENTLGIDSNRLLSHVEEAERAGLIAGTMQRAEALFQFSHELVRQTALAGISAPRRQRLHLAVANAMERVYGPHVEDHAVDLAHHLGQAGKTADAEKTVRYLAIAAKQALIRSASKEAIAHLTKELHLLKDLAHDSERDRKELHAQSALGVALQNVKGYAALEVDQAYTRARTLAEELGETAQLVSVLRGQAYFYGVRAEYMKALELGQEILIIGERNPEYLIEGDLTMGLHSLYLGQLTSSRAHLERGIAVETRKDRPLQMVQYMGHSKATCLSYLARTLWLVGYPEQALQRSHEALALAESMALPMTLAQTQGMHALLYQVCREIALAQTWSDRTIIYATKHGFAYWLALCSIIKGWLAGQTGEAEIGITRFRAGLDAYRATGAKLGLSWFLTLLAELFANSGQIEQGLCALQEAEIHIQSKGERYYEAEVLRLKGELLIRTGKNDVLAAAEACFLSSLDVARSQGAKSWELRTATSLARMWSHQDKIKEARESLYSIYGWFQEGLSSPDLLEAKQLLEELGTFS